MGSQTKLQNTQRKCTYFTLNKDCQSTFGNPSPLANQAQKAPLLFNRDNLGKVSFAQDLPEPSPLLHLQHPGLFGGDLQGLA